MKSLYKKEALELLFLFVPALIALSAAWAQSFDMDDAFLRPQDEPQAMVWLAAGGAGILLAYWQFAGERARSTHAYLIHRGVSSAEIVRAKAVLGAGAAFLLGCVPPLVCAGWNAWFRGEGGVFQVGRLAEYFLIATAGVSAYAVAAEQATSYQRNAGAALLRFGFVLAVVAAQFWMLMRLAWSWTQETLGLGALGFLVCVAAITAPALWIAGRRFERGLDAAHPVAAREAWVAAVSACLFVLVPGWMFFGATERVLSEKVVNTYPVLLHRNEAEFALGRYDSGIRAYRVAGHVESEPTIGSGVSTWSRLYRPESPWAEDSSVSYPRELTAQAWEWLPIANEGPLYAGQSETEFSVRGWLLQPAGEVVLCFLPESPWRDRDERERVAIWLGERTTSVTARRPDGRSFSRDTVTRHTPDGRSVLLLDPADQTLWRLAPEKLADAIVPLPLPEGRAPEEFVYLNGSRTRATASGVAAGDETYVFVDSKLLPLAEVEWLSRDSESDVSPIEVDVVRSSLFVQAATVRERATGAVQHRQSWDLRDTVGAGPDLAFAALQTINRPLPLAIASFLEPGDPPFTAKRIGLDLLWRDPLYFGGTRSVLLAAHALLVLTLVVQVWRRSRRGGLSVQRSALWAALVLLGGVWASILWALTEPSCGKRAERRIEGPAPREVLVVRAA